MSKKEQSTVDAILAQYEKNAKAKTSNSNSSYDLKNYFSTYLEKGVTSAKKRVRILPAKNEGETPFTELHIHSKKVDGKNRKFVCLKEMYDKDCPFCEAREELYSSGKESDKEIAKKYYPRKTYVCRVIDREEEDEGVKFWRFNHNFTNQGIFDKIIAIVADKGDVTDKLEGRDLTVHIGRDQNNYSVVQSITDSDKKVIHEDKELVEKWLNDEKTWEDVYSVKPYEYLEIIVKGGTPIFDKETKEFVNKADENDDDENDDTNELEEDLKDDSEDPTDTSDLDSETTSENDSDDDDEDDLPF